MQGTATRVRKALDKGDLALLSIKCQPRCHQRFPSVPEPGTRHLPAAGADSPGMMLGTGCLCVPWPHYGEVWSCRSKRSHGIGQDTSVLARPVPRLQEVPVPGCSEPRHRLPATVSHGTGSRLW